MLTIRRATNALWVVLDGLRVVTTSHTVAEADKAAAAYLAEVAKR